MVRLCAFCFAAVIVLAAAPRALAQTDQPRWFADVGDVYIAAKWGIPQTDAVGLAVRCADGGMVVIAPALYALEKPDVIPDVAFTVDDQPYVRPLQLVFSERDEAWQAEIKVRRDDEVITAMRRGSRLTYDFAPPLQDGDAFTLSLSGSAKAIDTVLSAC